MLPELILKEERYHNYYILAVLGFVSAFLGFGTAEILFPSESDLIAVFLAAIPLVFPLTEFFLDDEKEKRPHLPEFFTYSSLFFGEMAAFFALAFFSPDSFGVQISMFEGQLTGMGITGYSVVSVSFLNILLNNLVVFLFIFGVAALIGSAGAFILTWNASVLGLFLGILTRELSENSSILGIIAGTEKVPSALAYVPHASFEMAGFVVAGIAGSLVSAAVYREHFDRYTWENLFWFALTGLGLVFTAAGIETGRFMVAAPSLVLTLIFGYNTRTTTQQLEEQNSK